MKTTSLLFTLLLLPLLNLAAQKPDPAYETNWNQWRGPFETGVAPNSDPPIEWSETKNIKWKSTIPGIGHATPIIWENNIILLSAVPTDKKVTEDASDEEGEGGFMNPTTTDLIHAFTVICVDRNNGKIKWQTVVREAVPHSGTHEFGSWASNSPITDGKNIYAYFGSIGLYCLDFSGKVLWERNFGNMEKVMSFGEGSSPTLYKDKLVILRDHQGQSTIHVLNKNTGDIIWEKDRDEVSSWSTPAVLEYDGATQLITSASKKVRSYDLSTGKILWECGGLTGNVIPSPVHDKKMVYVMSGFRGTASMAIDLSKAKGDITGTDAIAWSYNINTPYTPAPVLADGKLYFLRSNNGFLTCLNTADGKPYYEAQKLEGLGTLFTSPIAAGGRLYVVGTQGTTCVVKLGEKFEEIAQNTLEDSFYASPVVVGNELFIRGVKSLYCITNHPQP